MASGAPHSPSPAVDPRRLEVEMARPWRRMLPFTHAVWLARPEGSPALPEVCVRLFAWSRSPAGPLAEVHHRVRSVEGASVLYLGQAARARLPELVAAFWAPATPDPPRPPPSGRPKVSLVRTMLGRLSDTGAPHARVLTLLKEGLVDRAELQAWEGILFETATQGHSLDVLTALGDRHPYLAPLEAWLRVALGGGDRGPCPTFPLPASIAETAHPPRGFEELRPEEALAALRLGRPTLCCPTLERHAGPLLDRLRDSAAVARLAKRPHPERVDYYQGLLLRLRGAARRTGPRDGTVLPVLLVEYKEVARCLGFLGLRERPEGPPLLGPAHVRTLALLTQVLLHHAHPTLSPESWWIRGSPMLFRLDRSPGARPCCHTDGTRACHPDVDSLGAMRQAALVLVAAQQVLEDRPDERRTWFWELMARSG